MRDCLEIAGKQFRSRLIAGTGRFRSTRDMISAIKASGAEMVTVAIRRLDLDNPHHKSVLQHLDWDKYSILPNTAGARTVEEAVFLARLGRAISDSNWVKLEVIPYSDYLLPDPGETLKAAEQLVKQEFVVLPYINADPVLARRLEEIGCATVMPLGSVIGSGQGIHTSEEIQIIIEQSHIPVIVDAGLGVPSDASHALEMGADAVLVNTAIAQAKKPALMAQAFKYGVEAGRKAFLAGRIPRRPYATGSSPTDGIPQSASNSTIDS